MSQCEQYRKKIEDILRGSDLSTITTKTVRRTLEGQINTSLSPMKKEINEFIEDIFMNFQAKQEERNKYVAAPIKKEEIKMEVGNKVVKQTPAIKRAAAAKKTTTRKKKEPKERKPTEWPLLKVNPPLSDIIDTQLCSRPQSVKKMWEYIRAHNLQAEKDKRIINCDAKFRELCDGQDQITAFSINKFTQKCFETIPTENQPKYKQILLEQEEAKALKEEQFVSIKNE